MSMQITFSTGTFYHRSLGYSLGLVRDAGYDGIELALGAEYRFGGLQRLQRVMRAYPDAPIRSIHPPFRGWFGWPRQAHRAIPELGAVTQALGVEHCVLHVSGFYRMSDLRARSFVTGIEDALAQSDGTLHIDLETNQYCQRPQRYLLDDLDALVNFAKEYHCGVTFDTCHVGANGQDILACYEIVRPVLANVHLNDLRWCEDGTPQTHILPGEGELPLAQFLGLLARDQYQGLITLEVHPTQIGLWGRRQQVKRLRKALTFVRSAFIEPALQLG